MLRRHRGKIRRGSRKERRGGWACDEGCLQKIVLRQTERAVLSSPPAVGLFQEPVSLRSFIMPPRDMQDDMQDDVGAEFGSFERLRIEFHRLPFAPPFKMRSQQNLGAGRLRRGQLTQHLRSASFRRRARLGVRLECRKSQNVSPYRTESMLPVKTVGSG